MITHSLLVKAARIVSGRMHLFGRWRLGAVVWARPIGRNRLGAKFFGRGPIGRRRLGAGDWAQSFGRGRLT